MGVLSRFATMIKGFFGKGVDVLEEKNPDIFLNELKNQIEKTKQHAEKQILEIQTNAELIKIEMVNSKTSLDRINSRIEAAREQGDIDLLTELIVQEEDYLQSYELSRQMYEKAMGEVARIRDDYTVFEAEMNSRLTELKTMKSQAKIASLRENITALNAQYSNGNKQIDRLNENIDRARDVVNIKTARAKAMQSLNEEDVEMRLKKMDMGIRKKRAREKAENMLELN